MFSFLYHFMVLQNIFVLIISMFCGYMLFLSLSKPLTVLPDDFQ